MRCKYNFILRKTEYIYKISKTVKPFNAFQIEKFKNMLQNKNRKSINC